MTATRTSNRHIALYRASLRLYPRPFRSEYGEPMAQLFADRVRDVGARAWLRTADDLIRTVPTQRIENLMSNRSPVSTVARLGVLAVLAVAVVLGLGGRLTVVVALISAPIILVAGRARFGTLFGADRAPLLRSAVQTWWAPLAALMGVVLILSGVGNALNASNWGRRVFGSTVLIALGVGALYGLTRRPFARTAGNTLVLVATVPLLAMFWMVIPPLVAIAIWIGVLTSGFEDKPVPVGA